MFEKTRSLGVMSIKVKVYAPGFIDHEHISKDGYVDLNDGATLYELLKKLKIPPLLRTVMFCSVNYERVPRKTNLKDGDVVTFIFPISGG
jgi:molybdopterin converting factor small subunit